MVFEHAEDGKEHFTHGGDQGLHFGLAALDQVLVEGAQVAGSASITASALSSVFERHFSEACLSAGLFPGPNGCMSPFIGMDEFDLVQQILFYKSVGHWEVNCPNGDCGPGSPRTWIPDPMAQAYAAQLLGQLNSLLANRSGMGGNLRDLETLSRGMGFLLHPLEFTAVSGAMFETGTAMVVIGAGIWVGGCGGTLGTGCLASLPLGAVPAIGGGIIDYAAYKFTKDETIPAWEELLGVH